MYKDVENQRVLVVQLRGMDKEIRPHSVHNHNLLGPVEGMDMLLLLSINCIGNMPILFVFLY